MRNSRAPIVMLSATQSNCQTMAARCGQIAGERAANPTIAKGELNGKIRAISDTLSSGSATEADARPSIAIWKIVIGSDSI